MKQKTYSTFQICRALHIPMPKLREWINQGFIVPSIPSKGRGKAAGFTEDKVIAIFTFMRLVSLGYSREFAAGFVASFQGTNGNLKFLLFNHVAGEKMAVSHFGENDLIFDAKSGNMTYTDRDGKEHTVKDWDNAVVLNIAKINEMVVEALKKLQ